jgi:hypothetical protein
MYMTPCVVVPRPAVAARPDVTILVIVVVIMLVAAASGWPLTDATALVAAAAVTASAPSLRGRRRA